MNIPNYNVPEETWKELVKIFSEYRKYTNKIGDRLESLGYRVSHNGGHVKVYIEANGKKNIVTISATCSDMNSGRVTLRKIRSFYD